MPTERPRDVPRRSGSFRRAGLALAVGIALAAGATLPGNAQDSSNPRPGGEIPPQTNDGPLRFVDLSNASAGPVDFGSPKSNVEKCSCAFFDADGDGWDDLLTLAGVGEGYRFLLNRPDGSQEGGQPGGRTFVPAPPGNGFDSGAPMERDGASLTVGDVDGDGDQDVYVGCGWNYTLPVGSGRNMLLLNDGAAHFTDVAASLGIADGDNTTAACLFFDMDLDGDLDLLSCNTDFPETGKVGDGIAHLFRNTLAETGALGFVEETAARGIVEIGKAVWAVLAPDYDGDGDLDLIITHDIFGLVQLFRNDGTGHFTDVTAISGSGHGDDDSPSTFGDDSLNSMGIAAGDPDNDGDLDLYISNIGGNPFYVNQGNGKFTQLARTRGNKAGTVCWGVSFCDFDLDGWQDLFVAGGDIWNAHRDLVRSWLFRNEGGATFTDVWGGSGMRRDPPLHREKGSAVADFDHDGRPDLLITRAERAGASPYLYHNVSDTAGRRWLQVKLEGNGTTTNRDAIGGKVRVFPRDASGARIAGLAQFREVEGGDSRGSRSSLVQHTGLGPDAVSADVEVEWPRAGALASRRQSFLDVPLDVIVTIPETPRADAWRLDALAEIVVPDVRETITTCIAAGAPTPLGTLAVAGGPAWVTPGPWQGERTIRTAPPRVTAVETHQASLSGVAQDADGAQSSQDLTVRVVPAPSIRRVRMQGPNALRVDGDHLDLAGLEVTLDGQPCKVVRVRNRMRGDGTRAQRANIRFPRSLRRAMRRGHHILRAVEPVAGFEASADL